MIDFANTLILFVVAGAAWLGVSAIVQKRTRRRDQKEHGSTKTAS